MLHSDNEKVSDTYLMHTFYCVRAVQFSRALNTHKVRVRDVRRERPENVKGLELGKRQVRERPGLDTYRRRVVGIVACVMRYVNRPRKGQA